MPEQTITLTIDPFVLPTTQHRAGLAGLMVLTDTMRRRGLGPIPEIRRDSKSRYEIRLTLKSLTAALNDMYDASMEEQTHRQKLKAPGSAQAKEPKRTETVTNEKSGKPETLYVYDQPVPRAPFLQALGIGPSWLKLWRDAVWSTLRGIPKTRTPFLSRIEGNDVDDAARLWKSLVKSRGDNAVREQRMDLAGSLFIGAQAAHADNVPFQATPQEILLLHFWPVVMGVFVPQILERDGKAKSEGFALAVPDVTDYSAFLLDFAEYIAGLKEVPGRVRPPSSQIALPEEAGLEYAAMLASITRARHRESGLTYSTAGVDVYHLMKRGNSIPILHSGRIPVSSDLLHQYEAIRDKYQHHVFRRQLVINILRGAPWFTGFQDVFARYPSAWFLGADGSRFQYDLNRKTKLIKEVSTHA